jgi:fucose 4-O-acetylase-like acetyltransferase
VKVIGIPAATRSPQANREVSMNNTYCPTPPANPASAETTAKRLDWLDAARGIGIVLVVAGHVERGLQAIGMGDGWAWPDFIIYSFHMPLFIFLAGVNSVRPLARGRHSYLKGRVTGVAYPYLLWATLTYCVWNVLIGHGKPFGLADGARHLLTAPPSPFWFLYVLFLFSCAYAFIGNRLLVFVPLVIMFCAAEFFKNDTIIHQLLHFPLFFFLGVHLSKFVKSWQSSHMVGLIFLCVAIVIITVLVAGPSTHMNFNSIFVLPAALAGTSATLLVSMLLPPPLSTWLARLGVASMAIYVTHLFFTTAARMCLVRLGAPASASLFVPIELIAGIMGPYMLYRIAEHADILPYVGWGRERRI